MDAGHSIRQLFVSQKRDFDLLISCTHMPCEMTKKCLFTAFFCLFNDAVGNCVFLFSQGYLVRIYFAIGGNTLNRENKRKTYQKGYYKNHACNDSFVCKTCGRLMTSANAGTDHRNHCSNCLCSLHVDNEPGDRGSDCGGIMEPVAVWARAGGEWAIIHRCRLCGKFVSNRIAADDNPMKLMSIAMRPLVSPPFPLERIEEMTRLMGGDGSMTFERK